MMKIRSGDRVIMTSGKDRGREGKVIETMLYKQRVLIEGINRYMRHTKPRGKDQPGKREERERPTPIAHIMLLCPACGQPARVGFTVNKVGKKVRMCKACKKEIN